MADAATLTDTNHMTYYASHTDFRFHQRGMLQRCKESVPAL